MASAAPRLPLLPFPRVEFAHGKIKSPVRRPSWLEGDLPPTFWIVLVEDPFLTNEIRKGGLVYFL